jgi:deoxyadenosine/deoxycytidine kinase
MSRKLTIISIEGNIGSGKSTLLENIIKRFKSNPNIVFLKEPVSEWENIRDSEEVTMLQKFYMDQKKYSFSFQMMAYITRLAMMKAAIQENPNATIFITERSLYTDKHVFAKMLHDMQNIEDVNYQIYTRWFDVFAQDYAIERVIYVKADPDVCNERINIRSRTGEDGIPIDYLTKCHEYHEKMITQDFSGIPVLTIDANKNIKDALETWMKSVELFVLDTTSG